MLLEHWASECASDTTSGPQISAGFSSDFVSSYDSTDSLQTPRDLL